LLILLPFGVWTCVLAYRSCDRPARAFALLVVALGALVVFGTEVVYLRDAFEGQTPRMNTLFKFYYQVWLLWGTVAGYALVVLLRRMRLSTALWLLPFVVLLVGALVYPALMPARNVGDRTLDGTAYIAQDRPGDAAAIAWIETNLPGDTVILEAPFDGGYSPEYASIATVTGRPTLLGWRNHELQWRGGQPDVQAELGQRLADGTTIYTTADDDEATSLLDKYGIAYVYVGPVERQFATEKNAEPGALDKFARFMDPVFSADGVTLYKRK
jgi:uncharacterized membrane protein